MVAETVTAARVDEAVAAMASRSFGTVFCDLVLPDGSVLDLLPHLGAIPCVVMGQASAAGAMAEALSMGAYDYIVKDTECDYLALLPITLSNVLKIRDWQTKSALVRADGVGLPEAYDVGDSDTLGMWLIGGLVRNQLKGSWSVRGEQGTEHTVRFKRI